MDLSYLFVPADRSERFDKALASGADQVIVDLEDAVPIASKSAARLALLQWLRPEKPVIVRVNSADTEWFNDDIALASVEGVVGLMVPKAEVLSAELVALCSAHNKFLIVMIETAVGFQNLAALAATPQVQRIAFGSIDFQVDLGIPGERDALLFYRTQLVLQSRLANLQAPLDGVTVDIQNDEQLTSDAEYAKHLGFGAKLCIHPKQIATVNRVFSPSETEVVWAAKVIAAMNAANGAAVAVDGKMVDKPVMLKAQRIQAASRRS